MREESEEQEMDRKEKRNSIKTFFAPPRRNSKEKTTREYENLKQHQFLFEFLETAPYPAVILNLKRLEACL